jgi:type I restriction enzyme, S subunit
MQETSLPWSPLAAAHWRLEPNKSHLRIRKVLVGARHPEYKLLSLTKQGVIIRDVSTGKGKFSADMGTSQEVRSGDLVFCLFDVPETPRTVGLARNDGMITGAYTVMECSQPGIARFLELFYKAMDDRKLLSPLYSGLRNTIPKNRLLGAKTPLPPPDEQAAIVKFLSYANGRIRRYIQAKLKLVSLLEEQKQVIIHRAVTRGVDPSARLKPSGVEWLGDVPGHWGIRRLKTLFREVNKRSETGAETLLSLRMYRGLVPHEDVSDKPIPPSALVGYKHVGPGQLVMNRMRAAIGIFGIPTQEGLVSPDYAVFDPANTVVPSYYLSLFKTAAMCSEFRIASKGLGTGSSGFMRLYTDQFGKLWVPFPPRNEQEDILRAIAVESSELESALSVARRELDLLHEYRTRLTADIVTGQLDVREAASKLPDTLAEQEAIDAGIGHEGDEFDEDDSMES